MPQIRIGTSGWSYKHWKGGVFYPEDLKAGQELEYYATQFDTVELNSTFYHAPREQTCVKWAARTPESFLFAVKVSKAITHTRRLADIAEPLRFFLSRVRAMRDKLGPLLFQLPPSLRCDIELLKSALRQIPADLRATFEFRHQSWFCPEVYETLWQANAALTIADSARYPPALETTANFVYVRLHGHQQMYASNYTRAELQDWAEHIAKWAAEDRDVYVYFDNDVEGHAPHNAAELKRQRR